MALWNLFVAMALGLGLLVAFMMMLDETRHGSVGYLIFSWIALFLAWRLALS